jgi:tetratricopeptide (TPR) repeat protein
MTRSLALYEKSEVLKESQGYYEAVNLLAKALQKTPDDPVLLFNQAIVCERIRSYECAKEDWTRLLAVEKDPNWIAEARKHLDAITEKKSLAP